MYSLNELLELFNSRESTYINLKSINIFDFLTLYIAWDGCQNLALSSMHWFPCNLCFSRPGLLNAGDPSYPWLADSWPATSLPVNNSNSGPNDIGNFGRGGKLCFINNVIWVLSFFDLPGFFLKRHIREYLLP